MHSTINSSIFILIFTLFVIQSNKAFASGLLESQLPTYNIPVAVIVTDPVLANPILPSNYLMTTKNQVFATGLGVFQLRSLQVGGWTVQGVNGGISFRAMPNMTIFNIGPVTSTNATLAKSLLANAIARAKSFAYDIPAGLYGEFVILINMLAQDYGKPTMFAQANIAAGLAHSPPLTDGVCVLFHGIVADSTQFNDNVQQLYAHSFGTLVPNIYGRDMGKLILAAAAAAASSDTATSSTATSSTATTLTFVIASTNSSSDRAINVDVLPSAIQVGLTPLPNVIQYWAGTDDASIRSTAQTMSVMNPDVVFLSLLSTETKISATLLDEWSILNWRPKALAIPGNGMPITFPVDPNDSTQFLESSYHNYIDAIGAVPWTRILKGISYSVDDSVSADPNVGNTNTIQNTELFTNNATAGTLSSEEFARFVNEYFPFYAGRADPVGPAIGSLPGFALYSAMQIGCNQLTNVSQCTADLIAAALQRVNKNGYYGQFSFVKGQINPVEFVVRQINNRGSSVYLSPLAIAQQTIQYPMASWNQLQTSLLTKINGYILVFSLLVSLIGSWAVIVLYGWLIQHKQKRQHIAIATNCDLQFIVMVSATIIVLAATISCVQLIAVTTTTWTNFYKGQSLVGYRAMHVGVVFVINVFAATLTILEMYRSTSGKETYDRYTTAQNTGQNSSTGRDTFISGRISQPSNAPHRKTVHKDQVVIDLQSDHHPQNASVADVDVKQNVNTAWSAGPSAGPSVLGSSAGPFVGHSDAANKNLSTPPNPTAEVPQHEPKEADSSFAKVDHNTVAAVVAVIDGDNDSYDYDTDQPRVSSIGSTGSVTTSKVSNAVICVRLTFAAIPVASGILGSTILLMYSIVLNATMQLSVSWICGVMFTNLVILTITLMVLFWPRLDDTKRLLLATSGLTLGTTHVMFVILSTATWTRTLEILSSTGVLDSWSVISIATAVSLVITVLAFGLAIKKHRAAVGDVKHTLKRERTARRQADSRATKTEMTLEKLLVQAPFELTNSAQKFSNTSMRNTIDDLISTDGSLVTLDRVLANEHALFHFVSSIVDQRDRYGPLFLYYVVLYRRLFTSLRDTIVTESINSSTTQQHTMSIQRSISQIIFGFKHHFFAENNINVSPQLLNSIKPNDLVIDNLKLTMFDSLFNEVKNLVRTNQWRQVTNRQKNYLAQLLTAS